MFNNAKQTMTGSDAENTRALIEAFFQTYQQAFQNRDLDALRSCFHAPVFVASDTGTQVRAGSFDAAPWQQVLERLLAQYQALHVGRVERRGPEVFGISARLATARVAWSLYDEREELLYEFVAVYTLELASDGIRIVAIAHDEAARARSRG